MATLVLINGAPGSGKSTLAQMFVGEHALALNLDVDLIRSMLGGWLEQPWEAGLLARRLAVAVARIQLTEGRDVLVPQYLAREEFLQDLLGLSREVGAGFLEVALLSDRQSAVEAFVRRSQNPTHPTHRDAAALVERAGGSDAVGEMYDRVLDLARTRPATRVIRPVAGRPERTYNELHALVCGPNCQGDGP